MSDRKTLGEFAHEILDFIARNPGAADLPVGYMHGEIHESFIEPDCRIDEADYRHELLPGQTKVVTL